jgi:hypothetical protein
MSEKNFVIVCISLIRVGRVPLKKKTLIQNLMRFRSVFRDLFKSA